MKLARKQGVVSQILQIFVQNASSTTGAGLTALTAGSPNLVFYYHRDTDSTSSTQVTLTTMTVGTYKSGGFAELNSAVMPGCYQICPPDAAFATTAASVIAMLRGATNLADLPIEIDLDSQVDTYYWNGSPVATPNTIGVPAVDVVRVSGATVSTSLAQFGVNMVSPTTTQIVTINGSLPGGAGGLMLAGTNSAVTVASLTVSGGFSIVGTMTVSGILRATNAANDIQGITVSTNGDKTGYSLGAAQAFNNTGTWTGNLTGSVGSVAGAVNSVNAGVTVSTNADKTGYSVSTVGDKTNYTITSNIKKNQALLAFEFLMTDSTLHAPATGLTVTVTRSINGGAFAAGTLSAVTEIANGIYAVDFGSGDLNGNVIVLQATAVGADTAFERIVSQP